MPFHPDQNLPGCMMPDGGECCSGHAAVCEDWHKQRATIARLTASLALVGAFKGRTLLNMDLGPDGDRAYQLGANAAFEQAADIAIDTLATLSVTSEEANR